MLDIDLAKLYGVPTKRLNEQVKRNRDRFPEDFIFQLTTEEFENLMFHFGTSSWGGTRKLLQAFTEQEIAMLSSVLRSKRAASVNIEIMSAFVRLREAMASSKELARRLDELEKRIASQDESIRTLFQAIRQLMAAPEKQPKKIGFQLREKRAVYSAR